MGADQVKIEQGGSTTGGSMALTKAILSCGGGLLAATAGIHLDLYLTGYRHIPTIGWLFLLQVISAFALALVVILTGLFVDKASRVRIAGLTLVEGVAGLGAGFALATLLGYLISLDHGLFGFREVRTTAGVTAAVIEVACFLLLGWVAAAPLWLPLRGGGVAVLTAAVVVLLVAGEAGATVASSGGSGGPKVGGGGPTVTVVIKNFAFVPSHVTAKPGETILVEDKDSVAHTFTGGTGASAFNSGPITPGGSRTLKAPTAAGTYPFHCVIHPFMKGVLTVT
jgi:plastocyanin